MPAAPPVFADLRVLAAQALAAARWDWQRQRLVTRAAGGLAALLAALLVLVALDQASNDGLSARARGAALAGLAGLGAAIAVAVARPLRRPPCDAFLAQQIERARPALAGTLLAAVQLRRDPATPPDVRDALHAVAAWHLADAPYDPPLRFAAVRQPVLILAGALLAWILYLLLAQPRLGASLARLAFLSPTGSASDLALVDPTGQPPLVIGRDVKLVAIARRSAASVRAEVFASLDAHTSLTTVDLGVDGPAGAAPGTRWTGTLPGQIVTRDLYLRLRSGERTTAVVHLPVRPAPAIALADYTVQPPGAARPSTARREQPIEVPAGSRLVLHFAANSELRTAALRGPSGPAQALRRPDVSGDGASQGRYLAVWTADQNATLELAGVDAHGERVVGAPVQILVRGSPSADRTHPPDRPGLDDPASGSEDRSAGGTDGGTGAGSSGGGAGARPGPGSDATAGGAGGRGTSPGENRADGAASAGGQRSGDAQGDPRGEPGDDARGRPGTSGDRSAGGGSAGRDGARPDGGPPPLDQFTRENAAQVAALDAAVQAKASAGARAGTRRPGDGQGPGQKPGGAGGSGTSGGAPANGPPVEVLGGGTSGERGEAPRGIPAQVTTPQDVRVQGDPVGRLPENVRLLEQELAGGQAEGGVLKSTGWSREEATAFVERYRAAVTPRDRLPPTAARPDQPQAAGPLEPAAQPLRDGAGQRGTSAQQVSGVTGQAPAGVHDRSADEVDGPYRALLEGYYESVSAP